MINREAMRVELASAVESRFDRTTEELDGWIDRTLDALVTAARAPIPDDYECTCVGSVPPRAPGSHTHACAKRNEMRRRARGYEDGAVKIPPTGATIDMAGIVRVAVEAIDVAVRHFEVTTNLRTTVQLEVPAWTEAQVIADVLGDRARSSDINGAAVTPRVRIVGVVR